MGGETILYVMARPGDVQDAADAMVRLLSHQLRTPLTPVVLELDVLAQKSPPELQPHVRRLQRCVNRLQDVVEAWIAAGSLRVGAAHAEMTETSLRTILEASIRSLEGLKVQRGVQIDLQCVGALRLHGDRDKLIQAFRAVVQNAVQHSPAGGTVVVAAKQIHDRIHVRVRDTGPGVNPLLGAYLFQPFPDAMVGLDTTGNGLGLWIARQILRLHNGSIALEDHSPGAWFVAWLPVAESNA